MAPEQLAKPPTEAEVAEAIAHSSPAIANIIRRLAFQRDRLRPPQGPRKGGMAAIMGRWPGNETDEEINAALKELS